MTTSNITDRLMEGATKTLTQAFGAIIKLAPHDDAHEDLAPVWVDGHKTPPSTSLTEPAKNTSNICIWHGTIEVLQRALESERALNSAYLSGRLKISGDMSVMTRLTIGKPQ